MFERGKKDGGFLEPSEGSSGGSFAGNPPGAAGQSAQRSASGGAAVIGRSIKINGDLRGDEDLRIEGDVSGTVELKNSSLTIGREGKIQADAYARSIAVDGSMEGDLYASEAVVIRANAHVIGNIVAPRVAIEDGAKFKGAIEMDQEVVDKALGTSKLKNSSASASRAGNPQSGNNSSDAKAPSGGTVKEAASS